MAATSERLSEFEKFVELAPGDPFPLYGLAMEHKSLGNLADYLTQEQEELSHGASRNARKKPKRRRKGEG